MSGDLDHRLTALEARVTALERSPTPPTPDHLPPDFWILNGLADQDANGVVFAGRVQIGDSPIEWQYGLSTPTIQQQTWADAAPTFAALGHPARLDLLRAILAGQTSTAELSQLDDLGSAGKLYHHLRELVAAGWLRPAGRGHHRVPAERVVPLLVMLAATEALDPTGGAPQ